MDILYIASAGYQLWPCLVVSGTEAISAYPIWDGTGVADTRTDWNRAGYGFESTAAKYSGTNGLNANGLSVGNQIRFSVATPVNTADYSFLSLWTKVNSYTAGKHLKVTFDNFSHWVTLDTYVNIYNKDWQQALIPLEYLGVANSNISTLIFESTGGMGFYFDDITLGVGALVYRYITVCAPEMAAHEEGGLYVDAEDLRPTTKAGSEDESPSIRSDVEEIERPGINAEDLRPSLRAFPEPTT
jgi:hypothetical protein